MDDSSLLSAMLATAASPVSTNRLLQKVTSIMSETAWLETGDKSALLLKHQSQFIPAVVQGFAVENSLTSCRNNKGDCACRLVLETQQAAVLHCELGVLQGAGPFLLIPLISGDQELGVIALSTTRSGNFSSQQIGTLKVLASIISNALCRLITEEIVELRELELEEARLEVVQKLGIASEYKDKETGRHILRMSEYAAIIAKGLDLAFEVQESIRLTAPMHDVGKIGIPDAILLKPGPLTDDEYRLMKTHTEIGRTILSGETQLMRDARSIAIGHHEKWDGSGYPSGLIGEDIPLYSRICAVSDVFDALTSKRPYKEPWPVSKARQYIEQQSGSHFDPSVVKAFLKTLPEILRVKELYRDEVINPDEKLSFPAIPLQDNAFFNWDDSLSVGIDTIDEHHRYLIDLTNDVSHAVIEGHGSKKIGRALKALISYTHVHFQAEEELMKKHGHPRLAIHSQEHAYFCHELEKQLQEFRTNPLLLGHETLVFLKEWLIGHVKGEDIHLRVLAGL